MPPLNSFLRYSVANATQTWIEPLLGGASPFTLSQLPYWLLLSIPAHMGWGGDLTSKGLLLVTPVVACVSMFLLCREILAQTPASCSSSHRLSHATDLASALAAVAYAFSPFLFSEYTGGATTQFLAHAFVPLPLLCFARAIRRERFATDLLLGALALLPIAISLQDLALTVVLLVGMAIVSSRVKRQALVMLSLMGMIAIVLSAYWLWPSVRQLHDAVGAAQSVAPADATLRIGVPSAAASFLRSGYFRPIYEPALPGHTAGIWLAVSYALVLVTIGVNLVATSTMWARFWTLAYLASAALSAVGQSPAAGPILWLYGHLALMNLFRSPQHLILLPALAFSLAFGCAIHALTAELLPGPRVRGLSCGALAVALLVSMLPYWSGDLGDAALRRFYHAGGTSIDVFRLSPGYRQAFDLIDADRSPDRIAFLPANMSPTYLTTAYQHDGQGGNPLFFGPHQGVDGDGTPAPGRDLVAAMTDRVCAGRLDDLDWLFGALGVRWVVVQRDVVPHFTGCMKTWDANRVIATLQSAPWLRERLDRDQVVVFENLRAGGLITITGSALPSAALPIPASIAAAAGGEAWRVAAVPSGAAPLRAPSGTAEPRVLAVRRNSATSYSVEVDVPASRALLVFAATYHQGWQAAMGGDGPARPLLSTAHLRVDGYANGWLLPPAASPYWVELRFAPQRAVTIGLWISTIGLTTVLCSLAIANRRRWPLPRRSADRGRPIEQGSEALGGTAS